MELVLTDLAAGKPAAEVTGPKPAVAVSDSPQPDKSQGDTSPEKPKSTAEVLPAAGQQPTTDAAVESIKGPGKEREKNDDGKS